MARKNGKKIKYRAPYEIPLVSDYKFAAKRFIKRIEFHLKHKNKELERLGIKPEHRKEYLDSVIDTEFAAMSQKNRKIRNNDYVRIDRAIERRKSDKIEYRNLLLEINLEIASLSTEYKKLEKLYKKCNPLYKGRLNVDGIKINGAKEDFEEGDSTNE